MRSSHTGADGFSRLARQAEGEIYILVDDFVGQGGTLANLRSHVIQGGGRVIGATDRKEVKIGFACLTEADRVRNKIAAAVKG